MLSMLARQFSPPKHRIANFDFEDGAAPGAASKEWARPWMTYLRWSSFHPAPLQHVQYWDVVGMLAALYARAPTPEATGKWRVALSCAY